MKYFFAGDWHLGHANIIKYCNRPFSSVEEMNETIIRNHNERVKPEDWVYFLGDFCFRNSKGGKEGEGELTKAQAYLKRVNGRFIFICGNHDKNNSLKTILQKAVIKYGNYFVHLVHNPELADCDYPINFTAHVHHHWKFKQIKDGYAFSRITDCINVGVDVWDFKPVTFEEIMKEYNKWKKDGKPQPIYS